MRHCPTWHDRVRYSAKSDVENEVKMLGVSTVDCDTVPYGMYECSCMIISTLVYWY